MKYKGHFLELHSIIQVIFLCTSLYKYSQIWEVCILQHFWFWRVEIRDVPPFCTGLELEVSNSSALEEFKFFLKWKFLYKKSLAEILKLYRKLKTISQLKKKRGEARTRGRFCIFQVTHKWLQLARSELDLTQEPGAFPRSLTWIQGLKHLAILCCFSRLISRWLVRNCTAGTQIVTHLIIYHYRWHLNPLHRISND